MEQHDLEPFIGEWTLEIPGAPPLADGGRARCEFEWLPGERFLVQRWEVPVPAAASPGCTR